MTQWEYMAALISHVDREQRVIHVNGEPVMSRLFHDFLRQAGLDGWELVGSALYGVNHETVLSFKRSMPTEKGITPCWDITGALEMLKEVRDTLSVNVEQGTELYGVYQESALHKLQAAIQQIEGKQS